MLASVPLASGFTSNLERLAHDRAFDIVRTSLASQGNETGVAEARPGSKLVIGTGSM